MIKVHEFNSLWIGRPVGISSEVDDLFMDRHRMSTYLSKFDWIEFRVPFSGLPKQHLAPANGAHLVETQLTYRKNISSFDSLPKDVEIVTADVSGIDFGDFSSFSNERYTRLKNIGDVELAQRYSLLAERLVRDSPSTCATVYHKSTTVGYIFGHINGSTAVFDLVVMSKKSKANGQILYETAGYMLRDRGARVMTSSFNAANLGALNAHVLMQCRFIGATSIWFAESNIVDHGDS